MACDEASLASSPVLALIIICAIGAHVPFATSPLSFLLSAIVHGGIYMAVGFSLSQFAHIAIGNEIYIKHKDVYRPYVGFAHRCTNNCTHQTALIADCD